MTDYRKRVVVPLIGNTPEHEDFNLIIYGRAAEELMTVPNDVIGALAARYPNHSSSPFLLQNLPDYTFPRHEPETYVESYNPRTRKSRRIAA